MSKWQIKCQNDKYQMTNVKNQRINFILFNLSVLLFIIASLSYHNYHHYCYHHHYYYHYFISLFARSLCSASLPRHNFEYIFYALSSFRLRLLFFRLCFDQKLHIIILSERLFQWNHLQVAMIGDKVFNQ